MTLPQIFILDTAKDWVVARSRFDGPNVYKFDFFEDALQILKGGQIKRETVGETKYCIDWKCVEKNKILKHELYYEGIQVKTTEFGILPVLYDNAWSWYFEKDMTYLDGSRRRVRHPWSVSSPSSSQEFPWGVPYKVCVPVHIPVPEPVIKTVYVRSPPEAHKMPRHLIRLVLDAAISKGESCPITMEPLTRESVVMTPCGHLFEREAIEHSLGCKEECPNCRSAVRMGELEGY